MDVFDRKIGPLLLENKKLNAEQLKTLTAKAEKEKKSLKDEVVADNIASEPELYKMYAGKINVPYTEFNAKEIPTNILKLIPEHIAKQYRVIIFGQEKDSKAYLIAMEDPEDVEAVDILQKLLGTNIRTHVATRTNISAGID